MVGNGKKLGSVLNVHYIHSSAVKKKRSATNRTEAAFPELARARPPLALRVFFSMPAINGEAEGRE